MAIDAVRLRDRRRRIGRMRARQPPVGRPGQQGSGARKRAATISLWDVFMHMPAALPFPIGSRFYDWKYESEPEPHMNGRRDLPRPRQGARRLEQHQRDDLPARQPAGLRALGRRPRHGRRGTTRTACRTSSGWRTASAAAPTTRTAGTTAARAGARAGDQPAVRARSSTAAAAGRLSRSPTTSTVTGRRVSRSSTATSTTAGGSRPPAPTCIR